MLFSLRVQLYGFEHAIGEEVNSAYPAKVILLLPDMLCCCLFFGDMSWRAMQFFADPHFMEHPSFPAHPEHWRTWQSDCRACLQSRAIRQPF